MEDPAHDAADEGLTVRVLPFGGSELETGASARGDVAFSPGHLLGRYVIVEEVGSGGMGRVYRAYDPRLRREVALKSLRPSNGTSGIARIVREAQAMARLSHPNVVPIYDVENVDGAVFITMEYVVGATLQEWLESPRSWRDIVRVFRGAGQGLAAAHAAGLVHRDFKPSNVMVGEDAFERARVMDFGLARADGDVESDPEPGITHSDWSGSMPAASQPLTQAGLVMGTPPYMAPESHRGGAYDGRGDQFSFCVALFEALYRQRPFLAKDGKSLLQAKLEGTIAVPSSRDVPAWLHRVVVRGLAARREDRYPNMDALLLELARDDSRQRRRWLAATSAAAVLGVAIVATRGTAADSQLCSGADARVATAWDPARRDAITTAFVAIGKPYATDVAQRVLDGIDGYADAWTSSYEDACRATQVRGEQSEALMDARMRCLEGRLDQLRAVTQTLGEADAAVVERAANVVERLPTIARCDDAAYVTAQVPPPDDATLAAELDAQRRELARAKALSDAGRYRDALTIATAVRDAADALDDLPLRVDTGVRLGYLHEDLGDAEQAVQDFEQAFHDGRRARLDEARIEAAIGLVHVLGTRLERPEAALQWAAHAEAEIDAAGDDGDRARLLGALGGAHFHRGEIDQARDAYERALALEERVHGERSAQVAHALKNLGGLYGANGDLPRAQATLERAVELGEQIYGPEHPNNVAAIENLGNVYNHIGRGDEAVALHLRSLAIQEHSIGADAPGVGETCVNLAYDYMGRLEYAEARKYFERAVTILEDRLGPEHPKTGHARSTSSLALLYTGDLEGALAQAERGAAIIESAHGSDHPAYGGALGRVAEAQLALGRNREAEVTVRRAIEIWSSKHGTDNPELAFVYNRLGRALAGQGRHAEAATALERALALHNGEDATFLADAHARLADALWRSGGDHARARELAQRARDGYAKLGAPARKDLARVDAWLAAHER